MKEYSHQLFLFPVSDRTVSNFCQLALVLECLVQVPTMLVNEKATVISADVPATNGIIQHLGLGVGGSLEEVDKC